MTNTNLNTLASRVEDASGPVRVQLSRAKGWRMPPNTVKVDRATNWGNPYAAAAFGKPDASLLVAMFRDLVTKAPDGKGALIRSQLATLRGKNLACWCPLDQPCHADVLLELANNRASLRAISSMENTK